MIQAFPVDAEAPEIPFCDETIETAATIRIFLGLSYSRLYKKHFTDESSAVIQVIAFLDKYECQMSKRLLEGETLKALMSDSVAPKDAFIIGALLESDELVKLVLRLHGTAPLGFYEYANFRIECDSCGCSNKSKKGRSIGHPVCSKCQCFKGTMRADVSHFSQLPAKYVCALVTANSAAVMGATFVTALKAFTNTVHQLEVSSQLRQLCMLIQDAKEIMAPRVNNQTGW